MPHLKLLKALDPPYVNTNWYPYILHLVKMCAKANCHANNKCNCKWPWAGNDRARNKSSSRNFIERHLQVPCVGVSIGIERIFAILEAEADRKKTLVRTTETEVYVATAHKKLHEDRMRIIAKLWDAGRRISIGIWIVTMSTMSCGHAILWIRSKQILHSGQHPIFSFLRLESGTISQKESQTVGSVTALRGNGNSESNHNRTSGVRCGKIN